MRNLGLKFFSVLGVALAGCSLKSADDDSSLYVDLSGLRDEASRFALLNPSGGFMGLVTTPPVSSGGFACYAVNVMGPGIPDTSSNPEPGDLGLKFNNLWNATDADSHCSYRGIASQTISTTSGNPQVVLQVPPGGPRLVQLVGVNDNSANSACTTGTLDEPPGSTGGSGKYFEVGRAKLNNFFSDQSVDVLVNWPGGAPGTPDELARSKRVLDCGGDCSTISAFTSAANEFSLDSSAKKVAFKITTVPGKYLDTIGLKMRSETSAIGTTVDLYRVPPGQDITSGSASPLDYTASVDVPVSASAVDISLDLVHTTFGRYQFEATNDYWLVVTVDTSATISNKLFIQHTYNVSPNSNIQYFSSGYAAYSSLGIHHTVEGCTN